MPTHHEPHVPVYEGDCFCRSVRFTVSGEPTAMGYCHCESCRQWLASLVNAFTLWPQHAVRVIRGEQLIGTFRKTPRSERKWCRVCGGHLFTVHPHWGVTDVYAALLPRFPFEPRVQVHCQEAMLRIPGDMPRFRDLPAEMGGSGVLLNVSRTLEAARQLEYATAEYASG